ncbi:MAG: ATP-dependent DNA ligase [Candidatus Woesearchaeota archaeon]
MRYKELVGVYSQLEKTTKRLEKTSILSTLIKKIPDEDLNHVMLLLQGRVFPQWDSREIGMSTQLLLKAITLATGIPAERVNESWTKTGDLGETAAAFIKKKTQSTLFSQELTTKKVFDNLNRIATAEGEGTVDKKLALFAELLTSATPEEAKYLVRTVLSELRIGLGEGTLRDAIVWASLGKELGISYDAQKNELLLPDNNRQPYDKTIETVQEAIDIANDYSLVASTIRQKGIRGLSTISLEPCRPVKVMMYQKAKNIQDAFATVGTPAAAEYKYDGFLIQVHKHNGKIIIFTRRLENVTTQFPDVVELVKKNVKGESYIIEAEAVGIDPKTGKYLPFQAISQRIKRKYSIAELAHQFPVEVNVFDILFYEGKNLLKTPFTERRKLVEKIINAVQQKIKPAAQELVSTAEEADKFYKKSLAAGNEGMMMKNLQGIYKPGLRVGYGMKIKPVMEPLDVVIVGAEKGEGKRAEWLASFVIAVRNNDTGEYVEIGRVGTGLKEKEEEGVSFKQISDLLLPLVTQDLGKEIKVKPFIVIEVNYEEIQASPSYSSGYALRFPRFVKLREDRSPEEISTIEDVKKLYEEQRGRGKQEAI